MTGDVTGHPYTYTRDFRILKRQSFEEVYYLQKEDMSQERP